MENMMNPNTQTSSSHAIAHLPLTLNPPQTALTSRSQQNSAKRLAKTKGMNREQWLQVRKQGIGSSDAAAACGLNPHMSMLELWMIKTGRMQAPPDQPFKNHYSPLYWGTEPLIADYYQQRTGNKVRRVNAVLQHPDEDKAFMLANLDYAVVVMKYNFWNVNQLESGEPSIGEGVPLYVLIQVQHQLAVTGKQAAHICALICGHEAKIFKVERNEIVINRLIASEKSSGLV
jgi:putative phage-type endonuclease